MKPTLASGLVLFALAATPATRPAYDSPAAVVAASIKADRDADPATQIACLSPAGQTKAAKFIVTMMVRGRPTTLPAKAAAEKKAFEDKHALADRTPRPGESPEQTVNRLVTGVPDVRAMLVDFFAHQKAARIAKPSTAPTPDLTDVTIAPDGNTATGKLSRAQGSGTMSQTLHFSRVDGSWLLDDLMFY